MFESLPLTLKIYIIFAAAVLGLSMGSFCNAWAYRIVSGESIVRGRSRCPKCRHELAVRDLFPLLSWLFLRGRCRYCGEPVSVRYPLSEALLGIYFVSVVLLFGISFKTLRLLLLGCLLLVMSLQDLGSMEIEDYLQAAAGAIALIRLLEPEAASMGLLRRLGGMALGLIPAALLLGLVLIMEKLLGREAMGGADIKLTAVLGLHFGALRTLLLLIIASVMGLITALIAGKRRAQPFPFGPSLAAAAWITALIGDMAADRYMSLIC